MASACAISSFPFRFQTAALLTRLTFVMLPNKVRLCRVRPVEKTRSGIRTKSRCAQRLPTSGRDTVPVVLVQAARILNRTAERRVRRGLKVEGCYAVPFVPFKYVGPYDGAHKHRESDYAGCDCVYEYKRETYMPEADIVRSVFWHVSERAPCGCCDDRKLVTVRLMDQ